jgi:phosphatidate cytidylyltransferase
LITNQARRTATGRSLTPPVCTHRSHTPVLTTGRQESCYNTAMLKHRVITAALGIPVIILAIWLGAPWFSLLIATAALVGTYEFYRMGGLDMRNPLLHLGLLLALALVLSPHYARSGPAVLPMVITAAMLVSLVSLLRIQPREGAFRNWAWIMAGALYVGWMLSHWLNLRGLEDGRSWVYLTMLTVFANDTGAFFVGRALGRHKLAPAVSPAKTWEGAAGGLVCSILGAIVIALVLSLVSEYTFVGWQVIVLGIIVSIFAQLGDLVESLLKRNTGTKESGGLLPGHGGVLDRFDSIIFVGAVVYYYVLWVI